ncbi:carbohydrate ABC transporter permease [Diplocloster agilis]|uniref:Carbohydrate ABC transporter permease n=1 Tax=Diplocloster agilis TaxID=2850323 RepID=A0A949NE65_9FIRM|nr:MULTISPECIES: carbohydrate ABC transporter permease [Lachnospiraceae]MBU9736801.1 carbohydrate ABC transporter permease [Diplocloster agilis]MBU9736810.1 carbohydrate ABC transporter permease [Diplocloster agilis]MCU6734638.1 carbohydrate ABC transporter permease [Suonthocola fibrivorans]SCJ47952.1 Inner membrane ABC transporter permease protein ycjP [uncultured Clostridium sp.]
MKKGKIGSVILFLVMLLAVLVFLYPLFVVVMNSFKPLGDIIARPLEIPGILHLENYINAWKTVEIPRVMWNTALVTVLSVTGIVLLSAMSAYWSERHPTVYSRIFSRLLVLSMLIPFASLMIPLVQVMRVFRLNNSLSGAIVTYWGIGLAFAFFMTQGAVKSLPYELEEAAIVDGCGPVRVFWQIILPLLQPTMVTIFVMDIFWIWNDFIVPLILLDSSQLSTIQLAIKKLFSQYSSQWDLALPALVISIVPILVVFVLLQKKIVGGILAGAVKG